MVKRILGLLGWLGVVFVFSALAISQLRPEWTWFRGLAIAGLVCTLLYVLSQWREIGRELSGRQARFGSLAAASVLVVLGILAGINYLAGRHNKRWDLTANRQYTLSDQTKKVLQGLTKPVKATVFARTEDFERFRNRLEEYQYQSKQFQVDYVDPEKRPALAERLKENSLGTIVLEYDGRVQRVTSDAEQDLTNGLIKVLQGKQHKVYFTQGHGERDTDRIRRAWLRRDRQGARLRQLHWRDARPAPAGDSGRRVGRRHRRSADGSARRRRSKSSRATSKRAASCWC